MGAMAPHLPKIEIEKFGGNFSEWPSFYDKFSALIDNSNLSSISKFSNLQTLLAGDAKKAIEGLALTAENYPCALGILKDRFGRKERISFGHVQNLLATDFQNSRNVKSLWNVYSELQTNIRSLESLGVDRDNYGLVLTPLIVSKLPSDMRLMWARQSHQRESDLSFLMSFLQSEIENCERSQSFVSANPTTSGNNREQCFHSQGHKNSNFRSTASALSASSSNSHDSCLFCSGGHSSKNCRTVFKMNKDDVKSVIRDNKLCFICFGKGHIAQRCYSKCKICNNKHNELFCGDTKPKIVNETKRVASNNPHTIQTETEISESTNVTFCQSRFSGKTAVLQTLKVRIDGVPITILFDSGSDKSFITTKAVSKLKPTFVGRESLNVSYFGSERPIEKRGRNVFSVAFDFESGEKETMFLTEIPAICSTMYKPAIPNDLLSDFDNCQLSYDVAKSDNITIDILVGQDYYWKLINSKACVQSPSGLVAQKTYLGPWILSGTYLDTHSERSEKMCRQFLCLSEIPQADFRKLWDLDYLGCSHDHPSTTVQSKVLEDFEREIKFVEGRYEVALPWINSKKLSLHSNANEARQRLTRLERKLSKDVSLKEGYDQVFRSMEADGIIEEVLKENLSFSGPIFYLPHRPVVKSSSVTTKIRPVFDASATGQNHVSLNDCMETGPNLLPLLSDVLLRFRRHKIAICADIEKAFLQISVRPVDRDVHRFFWMVDDAVRTMRLTRVPFGNRASPFLLNATVGHHLSLYPSSKRVIQELSQNMYCDDWLSGGDSKEEVITLMSEASEIMSKANMTLSKWSSNSEEVTEGIQRCFQDKTVEINTVKILGIRWLPREDLFTFDGMVISEDLVITKRVILSFIARTFDPLGLITPFTMTAKILFQDVWKVGLDWDEEVSHEIRSPFSRWIKDLSALREFSIPRCYVSLTWAEKQTIELHCFCDSSLKGYGAVIYLKVVESDGSVTVTLLMSKARVAPLKPVTLPRLELLGAVIAAKLLHAVMKALFLPEGTKYFCWTDSTVALQWIRSEPTRWKMFVCNRVVQIQELTLPDSWHHCSGKDNPADCLTRGMTAVEMMHNPLWFKDPQWLNSPIDKGDESEVCLNKLLDEELTSGVNMSQSNK